MNMELIVLTAYCKKLTIEIYQFKPPLKQESET